jgi:hypothetical protein
MARCHTVNYHVKSSGYCLLDYQKEDYKRSEGRQCSLPASMAASSTDKVSFSVQVILVTRRAEGRDLWFKNDQPWWRGPHLTM